MKKFLLLFCFLHFGVTFGATFIPISLEKQFEDADGVVKGTYVGKVYRKISDGRILTEATIKIEESAGIKPSEIVNKNNFKVVFPGGKWQGLDYKVSGTPNFTEGEKVLLILKKTAYGFGVKGLGLGKYIIVSYDDEKFYKSTVFPGHDKLGKIPEDELNSNLMKYFGETLESKNNDKFVYKPIQKVKRTNSRVPASIEGREVASEKLDTKEETTNPIWMIILFAALGTYSMFSMRKSRK